MTGAWRSAVLLGTTVAISGLLLEVLKVNPAPPLASLGSQGVYNTQWPSGHAAIQMSVALGMVLWWWGAGLPRPSIVAALVVPLAVLTGYSRAFLGIHLLSEVLSGWVLALLAASVVLIVDRVVVPRLSLRAPSRQWLVVIAAVVALAIAGYATTSLHRFGRGPGFGFGHRHGPPPKGFTPHDFPSFVDSSQPQVPTQAASAAPAAVLAPIAHFSETLLGSHVQPVDVVAVANQDPLLAAIKQAGWTDGQIPTPKDIPATFWHGITGGQDRDAAFTPTFLDGRSPDLVLMRTTPHSSDRHVAQVWKLPLETPNGCTVWAFTVGRSIGEKWSWPALYPEPHIASDIDTERDSLADGLAGAGFDDLGRFPFVGPMHGTGSAGSYVTDGQVAVVRQPDCG